MNALAELPMEPILPPSDTCSDPELRTGPVEMNDVALIRLPELAASDDFQRMNERLRASEAIVESLEKRGPIPKDALLTETLDRLVAEGSVDGLLIGSDDGFVVARSSRSDQADLLAVIGTVFEFVAHRIQAEKLIESVEEMVARGARGEQVVMRYFPGTQNQFFLVAYSREPATYRRTMARALKLCAGILVGTESGKPAPSRARRPRRRTEAPEASSPPPPDPATERTTLPPPEIEPAAMPPAVVEPPMMAEPSVPLATEPLHPSALADVVETKTNTQETTEIPLWQK